MEEDRTNLRPYRRANLEQQDAFTYELLQVSAQERYESLMKEIADAAMALNEIYALIPDGQARLSAAYAKRDSFFDTQGAYD